MNLPLPLVKTTHFQPKKKSHRSLPPRSSNSRPRPAERRDSLSRLDYRTLSSGGGVVVTRHERREKFGVYSVGGPARAEIIARAEREIAIRGESEFRGAFCPLVRVYVSLWRSGSMRFRILVEAGEGWRLGYWDLRNEGLSTWEVVVIWFTKKVKVWYSEGVELYMCKYTEICDETRYTVLKRHKKGRRCRFHRFVHFYAFSTFNFKPL